MVLRGLFILLLTISLIFETTLYQFPLIYILSFLLFFQFQTLESILIIFFATLILDAVKLAPFGMTTVFTIIALVIYSIDILNFDRTNYRVMMVYLFGTSVLYGFLAGYP